VLRCLADSESPTNIFFFINGISTQALRSLFRATQRIKRNENELVQQGGGKGKRPRTAKGPVVFTVYAP
jgi:hypothetical protein